MMGSVNGSALPGRLKPAAILAALLLVPIALLLAPLAARAGDRASFRVGEIDGSPVARIDVLLKTKKYPGMLRCLDQSVALDIVDRDGAIPPPPRHLRERPAELQDTQQRTLQASATYMPGKTASCGSRFRG